MEYPITKITKTITRVVVVTLFLEKFWTSHKIWPNGVSGKSISNIGIVVDVCGHVKTGLTEANKILNNGEVTRRVVVMRENGSFSGFKNVWESGVELVAFWVEIGTGGNKCWKCGLEESAPLVADDRIEYVIASQIATVDILLKMGNVKENSSKKDCFEILWLCNIESRKVSET